MNLPFYVFAWIACISYASETLVAKASSKFGMSNPWMFNFFWNLFIAVAIIIAGIFNKVGFPAHWGNIIMVAIFYCLSGVLFILSLYKLDVSVLAPLFSIRNALAVLFAALLVHEILTPYQYGLIFIIFIFGIIASVDEKWSLKSFFNFNILIALSLMASLALEGVFIKKAVAQTNYWETTLWMVVLAQVFLLFTVPLFFKSLKTVTTGQISSALLSALGGFIGTLAANEAYSKNIGISSAIISIPLSMVLVLIFSYFKPGLLEKHTLKIYVIRFASAAVMITVALRLGST